MTRIRGVAQLTTEAVLGLTDLVEALHARIATVPVLGTPPADGRTRGITGLVYKTVRGVTRGVGGRAQALLGWLGPRLATNAEGVDSQGGAESAASNGGTADAGSTAGAGLGAAALPRPERDALVSALNGVVGDHLAATGNPLAIAMGFRQGGRPLVLEREALRARLPGAWPRPLILLHGLCMNDLQWQRDGDKHRHDHGAALARDAGFTPVYLHYNTGLSIATNGRQLALQMEQLLNAWPVPITGLTLLGHSMGGLVARSALHHAGLAGQGALRWPSCVSDLVCLGTPHRGAPLESAGHMVSVFLSGAPYLATYTAPLARLALLRSAGIKDLRHGNVTDDAHQPNSVALPEGPRCYAVAADLKAPAAGAAGHLLGDGLVSVASALGQHRLRSRRLNFPPEHQAVVHSTSHLGLLSSPEVYAHLRRWLKPESAPARPGVSPLA